MVQVQQTSEQNHLLQACQRFRFRVPQYVQGPKNPIQPHNMLVGDIIQRLLALLYRWSRCPGGLERFQSRLVDRTNTHLLLWSTIQLNFVSTGQDSINLSPKICSIPS